VFILGRAGPEVIRFSSDPVAGSPQRTRPGRRSEAGDA